jgi:hypothetical protein
MVSSTRFEFQLNTRFKASSIVGLSHRIISRDGTEPDAARPL